MRRSAARQTGSLGWMALVGTLVLGACAPATVQSGPGDGEGTVGASADPVVLPALPERPVPGPVVPPAFYRRAVETGTRSPDGSPGPGYWRNTADYDIAVRLDPATARLAGRETIRYANRSPDTLGVLVLHLHQNLHAPGVMRNEAQEVTGGVELTSVRVEGADVTPAVGRRPFYQVDGQLVAVALDRPLLPGATAELEIGWEETLPRNGAGRMGWSDREVYYVGYWYPKMAVYDDLRGWDAEPYLGAAEFYDEPGDYDLRITVPVGWTVMATGDLTNAAEVYPPPVRDRLGAAATADTVVHVVAPADRAAGAATAGPGTATSELTYRFRAENVRDVAWTASDVQRWDATSALVPDRDGDGAADRVLIHAFWREDRAPLWKDQALYGKHAIEFHSRYTGFAYPWPHMTSVEGADIIGGGMEFPMMTLIGPYVGGSAEALYNVTSHELGHMWIPMIVSTNEKRYAWLDEGSTTFLENQSRPDYWPGAVADQGEREGYFQVARAGLEQPLMRHGDYYEPGPGYGTASYSKPATLLFTLRNLLGDDVFQRAYRTFIDEWAYKHPTPWDLFSTFERFADRDLDWFWTSFYYETWTMDQAVAGVERRAGRPVVVIEDRGRAPMPVRVRIETTRGGTLERELPVNVWLGGATRAEIALPASVGDVTRVQLDPEQLFPDLNRENDVWTPR